MACDHNTDVHKGLLRELNPGPLAPEARIIPLDQAAMKTLLDQQRPLRAQGNHCPVCHPIQHLRIAALTGLLILRTGSVVV